MIPITNPLIEVIVMIQLSVIYVLIDEIVESILRKKLLKTFETVKNNLLEGKLNEIAKIEKSVIKLSLKTLFIKLLIPILFLSIVLFVFDFSDVKIMKCVIPWWILFIIVGIPTSIITRKILEKIK